MASKNVDKILLGAKDPKPQYLDSIANYMENILTNMKKDISTTVKKDSQVSAFVELMNKNQQAKNRKIINVLPANENNSNEIPEKSHILLVPENSPTNLKSNKTKEQKAKALNERKEKKAAYSRKIEELKKNWKKSEQNMNASMLSTLKLIDMLKTKTISNISKNTKSGNTNTTNTNSKNVNNPITKTALNNTNTKTVNTKANTTVKNHSSNVSLSHPTIVTESKNQSIITPIITPTKQSFATKTKLKSQTVSPTKIAVNKNQKTISNNSKNSQKKKVVTKISNPPKTRQKSPQNTSRHITNSPKKSNSPVNMKTPEKNSKNNPLKELNTSNKRRSSLFLRPVSKNLKQSQIEIIKNQLNDRNDIVEVPKTIIIKDVKKKTPKINLQSTQVNANTKVIKKTEKHYKYDEPDMYLRIVKQIHETQAKNNFPSNDPKKINADISSIIRKMQKDNHKAKTIDENTNVTRMSEIEQMYTSQMNIPIEMIKIASRPATAYPATTPQVFKAPIIMPAQFHQQTSSKPTTPKKNVQTKMSVDIKNIKPADTSNETKGKTNKRTVIKKPYKIERKKSDKSIKTINKPEEPPGAKDMEIIVIKDVPKNIDDFINNDTKIEKLFDEEIKTINENVEAEEDKKVDTIDLIPNETNTNNNKNLEKKFLVAPQLQANKSNYNDNFQMRGVHINSIDFRANVRNMGIQSNRLESEQLLFNNPNFIKAQQIVAKKISETARMKILRPVIQTHYLKKASISKMHKNSSKNKLNKFNNSKLSITTNMNSPAKQLVSLSIQNKYISPVEIIREFADLVNRAKRDRKTYTVCGNFYSIRRAFAERGWVEKIRINIMSDREEWKKIDALSNLELVEGLRDKNDGEKYRKVLLSKLLSGHQVDFYWDYLSNPFTINNDKIKRTLINRFPAGATRSYTTKPGLCESLKDAYWYFNPGESNILYPRTYNLCSDLDIKGFIDDFRFTAATSLLKWVLERAKTTNPIVSRTGTISTAIFNFSVLQCQKFLHYQLHLDLEVPLPTTKDSEWNLFLEMFYKIMHQGHHFRQENMSAETMAAQAKCLIDKLQDYLSYLSTDGTMNLWLLKPHYGSRGNGILVCRTLKYMLDTVRQRKEGRYLVQKYIERPLLIHDAKFDIRQWFLVGCIPILKVWMYKDCYLRFSSQKFNLTRLDESIHLTNNSVQCKYRNAPRSNKLPENNMWHSDEFRKYLTENGYPFVWRNKIYKGMKEALVGLFMLCQEKLTCRTNSFELCGADFMINENFEPYLIEINARPALGPTTRVTARMCPRVLEDVIKVTIDNANNQNASTGNFELIFSDTISGTIPPTTGLCVEGLSCEQILRSLATSNGSQSDPSKTTLEKIFHIDADIVKKDPINTLTKIFNVISKTKNNMSEHEKNRLFSRLMTEYVTVLSSLETHINLDEIINNLDKKLEAPAMEIIQVE